MIIENELAKWISDAIAAMLLAAAFTYAINCFWTRRR